MQRCYNQSLFEGSDVTVAYMRANNLVLMHSGMSDKLLVRVRRRFININKLHTHVYGVGQ